MPFWAKIEVGNASVWMATFTIQVESRNNCAEQVQCFVRVYRMPRIENSRSRTRPPKDSIFFFLEVL